MGSLNALATQFNTNPVLMYLFIAWVLIWKGFALWRTAQKKQQYWFIAMLILNTAGILEILYLFIFSKMKKNPFSLTKKEEAPHHTHHHEEEK